MTRLLISDASGPIAEVTICGNTPFVWWTRHDTGLDRAIDDGVPAIEAHARRRGWTVVRREEARAA